MKHDSNALRVRSAFVEYVGAWLQLPVLTFDTIKEQLTIRPEYVGEGKSTINNTGMRYHDHIGLVTPLSNTTHAVSFDEHGVSLLEITPHLEVTRLEEIALTITKQYIAAPGAYTHGRQFVYNGIFDGNNFTGVHVSPRDLIILYGVGTITFSKNNVSKIPESGYLRKEFGKHIKNMDMTFFDKSLLKT